MEASSIAFIVALSVLWLASAGFCAWLADAKGRDSGLWFLCGLLFGIAALITIAGAPAIPKRLERQCPQCDESISVNALVCRWCRTRQNARQATLQSSDLGAFHAEGSSEANAAGQPPDYGNELKLMAVAIGVIVIIIAIVWLVSVAID